MLFEILVFVVPMSSVHAIMKAQKEEIFPPAADKLSPAIAKETGKQQLDELVASYQDLENVPTWPVDPSVRRRFTVRNLGLLIPFAGYILGNTPFWQQVSDVLKG